MIELRQKSLKSGTFIKILDNIYSSYIRSWSKDVQVDAPGASLRLPAAKLLDWNADVYEVRGTEQSLPLD